MRGLIVAGALLIAAPAWAQIHSRPTDAPIVTAENESWYRLGEPLFFAGDRYYPAGPVVFFNGNTMVRTGHYNGVPLYADTTFEPYSVVFVPIGRGIMQPYERPRRGELAGTTGSRTPQFPVEPSPGEKGDYLLQAAVAPTNPPQPLGAISAYATEPLGARAADDGAAAAQASQAPIVTLMRPENNDGVWVLFAGFKWISNGIAVPLRAAEFELVGEYAGFPVFARRGSSEPVIYIPSRAGLVAPYRRKE